MSALDEQAAFLVRRLRFRLNLLRPDRRSDFAKTAVLSFPSSPILTVFAPSKDFHTVAPIHTSRLGDTR